MKRGEQSDKGATFSVTIPIPEILEGWRPRKLSWEFCLTQGCPFLSPSESRETLVINTSLISCQDYLFHWHTTAPRHEVSRRPLTYGASPVLLLLPLDMDFLVSQLQELSFTSSYWSCLPLWLQPIFSGGPLCPWFPQTKSLLFKLATSLSHFWSVEREMEVSF